MPKKDSPHRSSNEPPERTRRKARARALLRAWQARGGILEYEHYVIEQRLGPLRHGRRGITVEIKKRKVKVYLVPLHVARGDVVIVARPRSYYGFLDRVTFETLPNRERWATLRFDCMEAGFVHKWISHMQRDDFPWDEIAIHASSCVIELELEATALEHTNHALLGAQVEAGLRQPMQSITDEGSWWILHERATVVPDSALGIKYEPAPDCPDPTSILTHPRTSTTVIGRVEFPPIRFLRELIQVSHRSPELAKRYP